jgi:hypothetical protein
MDNRLKINPPLYLMGKKIYCWSCNFKMTVITLLAPHVEDTENQICILSDIDELPNGVLSYIQKKAPNFKRKFSKMARKKYFANTCPKCNVISGDFFLHSEPGAPFFPTDEAGAKSLYITEIPLSEPIMAKASLGLGVGDLILKNAKRI